MRLSKFLVVVHALLFVAVSVLSRVFGDNADTTLGDWFGLGVLYAVLVALPTMMVSVVVGAVTARAVPRWHHTSQGPGFAGLLAGPLVAALVIAITNDGDSSGPGYLLGCALFAILSLALWAWFGHTAADARQK